MKSFLFDLSESWVKVLEYFDEMINANSPEYSTYYSFDAFKIATCWLSIRIYKKTEAVCLSTMEIDLPFEIEMALFNNADALIQSDSRLQKFENYLDFIDLNSYNLPTNIDIKVINRSMIITKL